MAVLGRAMKTEELTEYFEKNKFEGKIALIGKVGSNGKSFQVLSGKKGIQVPAIFVKELFNSEDIRPVSEGRFIPIIITDKKYISKEVLKILETNKSAIFQT